MSRVGQSRIPIPTRPRSSSSGGGGASVDHFEATIIVGNTLNGDPAAAQAAPFRYIADPGDGSGVLAAIAAATSSTRIRIRPGSYTFPVGSFPSVVTIPSQCVVEGSGAANTYFFVEGPDERAIFFLAENAQIRDIHLQVESPGNTPSGDAVITLGASALAERMVVEVGTQFASQDVDSLRAGILLNGSGARVSRSLVLLRDPVDNPTADPRIAFFQVGPRQSGPTVVDARIDQCFTSGYGEQLWVAGTAQRLIADISGDCQAQASIGGSYHHVQLVSQVGTAGGPTRAYQAIVSCNDSLLELSMHEPGATNTQGYVDSFGTNNLIRLLARNTSNGVGINEDGTFDRWEGVCGGGSVTVTNDSNTFVGLSTGDSLTATQALSVSGDNNVFVACRFASVTFTGTGNEASHNPEV